MAEPGRSPGRTQGYAGTWPAGEAARAGGFAPSGFSAWPSLVAFGAMTLVLLLVGTGRLLRVSEPHAVMEGTKAREEDL